MRHVWLILAVLLSPIAMAVQLIDGEGFVYDVGANGVLVNGSLNAYQNMYNLRVNNSNYVGDIERLNEQGRQVITTVYAEPNSGLQIRRRIYVAAHYNFARYMEILHNPSSAPVVVDVEIYGDLGAGERNNLVHSQAQFLITDDGGAGMPALLHYHSQVANPIQAEHRLIGNKLNWLYKDLTVPANSTVRLIYFIAQSSDPESARQLALQFPSNPSAFYEAIPPHEREELINFYPPVTTSPEFGDNVIFLNHNEVRTSFNLRGEAMSSQRANIPAQYFSFDALEGQNLALRMTANFDAYLYLFDAQGKLLASNDNARANTTNAEIIFTAPDTARFYLEATAHDQRKSLDYGEYSIALINPAPNRRPQTYGFKIDYLQTTLPVKLLLTAFTDEIKQIIEYCWHFDDNTVPQCSENHTIEHSYQQAGYYNISLSIRDAQGYMDSYTQNIALNALSPDGIIFPINTTINSELSTDNPRSQTRINAYANRYIIKAPPVGRELVIEMRSTAFDSFLYLYDSYGRQLRFDDNSGGGTHAHLRYTPLYSTDYVVEATSFHDNALGPYELSVNSVLEDRSFHIPIEAAADLHNGLKNTFVARIPQSFGARFFLWRFGDGEEFAGTDNAIVSHTFRQAGIYQVSLEVHNAAQQIVTGKAEFRVSDRIALPQAKFTVSPLFGEVPLRTFFNNDSQAAYIGDTLTYLWQFGDGRVATGPQPVHTYRREGVYTVILRAYSSLTALHSAHTIPITVIDRSSSFIHITGINRQRPQVLMAGFDPILQDILDTEATIFAIIRAGDNPIQSVQLLQNNTDFRLAMQHVATYANGDQHYATILTFPRGAQPATEFDNLFGSKSGQFQIRAVDQAGQFHAYPNVEISQHSNISNQNQVLRIEPAKHVGVKRFQPQVLAAGFDPILIDRQDGEIQIVAIVRPGLYPIDKVELLLHDEHGNDRFSLNMRRTGVLPNGDKIYTSTYTYPQLSVGVMTISDWFGFGEGQFSVRATDQDQRSHSFPRYKVGNYSPR